MFNKFFSTSNNRAQAHAMEAIAALSLAANVFQVVDFAHKLLSTGQQIYQAGSTVQNAELEVVVQDFAVLNKRLQKQSRPDPDVLGPLSKDDQVYVIE
jgi:hypothetical protein